MSSKICIYVGNLYQILNSSYVTVDPCQVILIRISKSESLDFLYPDGDPDMSQNLM